MFGLLCKRDHSVSNMVKKLVKRPKDEENIYMCPQQRI